MIKPALQFLLLFILPPLASTEPFRIRILCYNIHHGEGIDRKLDLPRIAKVIQSVSPDVVALQEVDQGARRTMKIDQAAELARLTGMDFAFGKNIEFQGGGYGNAVLSKIPIKSHRNHHLPNYENGEQRGVLICELQPKSFSSPILFLCTHLDHRKSNCERLASAVTINAMLKQHSNVPAILAGDLNASFDNEVLDVFRTQWKTANSKSLPTVPVTSPEKQIDFILSRPAKQWKTREVQVLPEAVASDHRAIFAVLELLKSQSGGFQRVCRIRPKWGQESGFGWLEDPWDWKMGFVLGKALEWAQGFNLAWIGRILG